MSSRKPFATTSCGAHEIGLYLADLTRENRRGMAEIPRLRITIDQDQPPSARAETLIHECLHVAQYFADSEQDEARVHTTAAFLAQLLAPFMRPVR